MDGHVAPEAFRDFLNTIEDPQHRAKLDELLGWVADTWPALTPVVKWKQPMFVHDGTFIVGFSAYPKNIAMSPGDAGMERFREAMHAAGYTTTQRLMRIMWTDPIDRGLLAEIVEWQLAEKAGSTTFWRS